MNYYNCILYLNAGVYIVTVEAPDIETVGIVYEGGPA